MSIKRKIKITLKKIITSILNTTDDVNIMHMGYGVRILGNVVIRGGRKVVLEDYVSIQPGCELYGAGGITIKKGSILAHDVMILSQNHKYKGEDLKFVPFDEENDSKEVVIGEYCWIGARVIILPGVHIGKGCVIGAGAVVTKNVPDYAIVGGNPSRILSYRDNIETFEMLCGEELGFIKHRRS